MDFVGALGGENLCRRMVCPGDKNEVPAAHLVISEINIGGSLVGTYTELVEPMEMNAEGKVKMQDAQHSLGHFSVALDDFKHRHCAGRGMIVP